MKQLNITKKSSVGPWLSTFGFTSGIICVILSIIASSNNGIIIGAFSIFVSFVSLIIYSDTVQRVVTYTFEDYECVDMGNFYLIVFCDVVRKNHLVASFFTKQAYEVINKKHAFNVKMEFNYFDSNKNPDKIITIIGEEHVYATSLKTWNPKI